MSNERLISAARDEPFSHVNRCGVLSATAADQSTWMDETIDYIGERYPDLNDADLKDLHAVGLRFCQPAINNITSSPEPEVAEESTEDEDVVIEEVTGGVLDADGAEEPGVALASAAAGDAAIA